jgi:hypothetical protein
LRGGLIWEKAKKKKLLDEMPRKTSKMGTKLNLGKIGETSIKTFKRQVFNKVRQVFIRVKNTGETSWTNETGKTEKTGKTVIQVRQISRVRRVRQMSQLNQAKRQL